MRKLLFLTLFLLSGYAANAQIEIGLIVSPTIAGNRFIAEDRYNFEKESNNLHLGVGVIADYFFSQNYAFSTGVIYRGKGSEISYLPDGSTPRAEDNISLQYIEVPLTLKLFTNEIAPGMLAYFQVGGSLNTKVAAQVDDKKVINSEKVLKRFNIFEADVLLGGGVEFQIGQSTKLFGGLTYHRGLTDIDDFYEESLGDKNISIKNNSVSIDFGVKF